MITKTENFRVTGSTLNVRLEPTVASKKIGSLKKDAVITRLGENETSDWVKILFNGVEGWIYKRYLRNIPYVPPLGEDFAWMEYAEKEKGVQEIPGEENNLRVVEYLHATKNLGELASAKDETPWCSAFVNWCVSQAGYEGTKHAAARSWLDWGVPIKEPRRGCIVVFKRFGPPGSGHVGFYLGETEKEILLLGGNQQNLVTKIFEVSEKYYPKKDLLGYRIPG